VILNDRREQSIEFCEIQFHYQQKNPPSTAGFPFDFVYFEAGRKSARRHVGRVVVMMMRGNGNDEHET